MSSDPIVHFRQRTLTYGDAGSIIHISLQCFLDYIWILITEDDTCAPGVIIRFDPYETGLATTPYYNFNNNNNDNNNNNNNNQKNILPSVPCECLLGVRDHPLTNVVAGVVAHAIHTEGENRPILLCISLMKTSKRLLNAADRMDFVKNVKDEVMKIATNKE